MQGSEFIIAALAIITGTALTGYIFMNIFKLIRSWIGGNSEVDEESFNRLAKAFMDHKKKTERRLKNLEAIASEKDEESTSNSKQIEAPKQDITMDDHDTEEQKSSAGDNNLRNMLRE